MTRSVPSRLANFSFVSEESAMSATSQTPEIDRYELAVDQAIAICGGDVRGALKACIFANEYLKAALQAVYPTCPPATPEGGSRRPTSKNPQ